jgi:glycine/D-amino acid oxidase-like deaminating enzyme
MKAGNLVQSGQTAMTSGPQVAVIGAGAFGCWTALYLLRCGARVTVLDPWGPGHSRASSGGETRIIRATYGPNQPYSRMAARALAIWKEHETRWHRKLLHTAGVLWMAHVGGDKGENDEYERASLPSLREAEVAYQELSANDVKARWPQINTEDISWAIYESECGFLSARVACQAVMEAFLAEGGSYRAAEVLPESLESGARGGLMLSDGTKFAADLYLFACGPWLGKLFPKTIGSHVLSTKQEVFFFGTPAGDDRFSESKLPVWGDHVGRFFYGIPASDGRGFKVADDTRGPEFDPTTGERTVSAEGLKIVRDYITHRFPAMKDAPLVETRVCQYENTPDNDFLIDRHPAAENVWLIGGGSGHGFKHGPALGEMVAHWVLGRGEPDQRFRLSRF